MRALSVPRAAAFAWPLILGVSLTLLSLAILGWLAPAEVQALAGPPETALVAVRTSVPAIPATAAPRTPAVFTSSRRSGGGFPVSGSAGGGPVAIRQTNPFLGDGGDLASSPPMPGLTDLALSVPTNRAWGVVTPGDTVTVTVNGTQMGASRADGIGFFWTTLYRPDGTKAGLTAGDVVRFYEDGSQIANITLRDVDAQVDVSADTVAGTVTGAGFPISVTVYAPADRPLSLTNRQDVNTGGGGDFYTDFSADVDLWANAPATVGYVEGGVEVQYRFYGRRLRVMPWPINWVDGYTDPGMAVTMTLLKADSSEKTQMTTTASADTGEYYFDVLTAVLPSEMVVVQWAEGTVLSRSVFTLTLETHPQNDVLRGTTVVTLPALQIRGRADQMTADGWRVAQADTLADYTGAYTISFKSIGNIVGGNWGNVRVVDDEGDELALWDQAANIEVDQTWNSVSGVGMTPYGAPSVGQVISLTLASTEEGRVLVYTYTMDFSGQYMFSQDEYGLPDIVPGDVVTVAHLGFPGQGVVHVAEITLEPEPDVDRVAGTVVSPTQRVEFTAYHWAQYPNLFPEGGYVDKLITATSPFDADLVGFDLHNGAGVWALHRVPGDFGETRNVDVNWIEICPRCNGGEAVLAPPGTAYTFTLLDSGGGLKAELTGETNEPIGNSWWRDFWDSDERMQIGDVFLVQAGDGFSQSVEAVNLVINANADTDLISGHGPPNSRLFIQVEDKDARIDQGWVATDEGGNFALSLPDVQSFTSDGDLEWGDTIRLSYQDASYNRVREEYAWPGVRVNFSHDWVGADYPAEHTFWITVTDSSDAVRATATIASSYGGGWSGDGFQTEGADWTAEQPDIQPGDWVYVRADDGYSQTIHVGEITGRGDAAGDWVSGTVSATWFSEPLDLTIQVWESGGPSTKTTVDPNGGSYYWHMGDEFDLLADHNIAVMYEEPGGNKVIYVARAPGLRVNYGHDWVECTDYPIGHDVAVTLTNGGGDVKATIALTTHAVEWWNGETGFATQIDDGALWHPAQPDFEPGDRVVVTVDDGYSNVITIGEVIDEMDVAADTVSGTINAPWFDGQLVVACEIWEENGPGFETTADADGGSFFCDFAGVWDLRPGDDVGIAYLQPNHDRIYNVFEQAAPDMRVEKWNWNGEDIETTPGGRMVFGLRYWNQGAVTGSAILSDTMPAGASYVWDGSVHEAHVSGNVITWDLGLLPPDSSQTQFMLVLENTGSASDTFTNMVDILPENDADWNNNHAEATIHVADANYDLWVNKEIDPGDPAAGQRFLYRINYGNGRPVVAGPVLLTDTLPAGTSLLSWESQDEDYLWTEVITTGGLFVLQAPALPGNSGNTVNLWLRVDDAITYNTELHNVVDITAPGTDDDLGNNHNERSDATGSPRPNTRAGKSWGHGTTMPDTEMNMWLQAANGGNVPVHGVVFTDTLPAETTLVASVLLLPDGSEAPFLPDHTTGNRLVWDFGDMDVAETIDWLLRLRIDDDADPGTMLTNCVTISMDGFEENPYDQQACATQTVRAAGPNLQIVKTGQWEGNGSIHYSIAVRNVGDTTVEGPVLTDDLPDGTTLRQCENDFWEEWSSSDCVSGTDPYTIAFSRLEPNWATNVQLWVDVPAAEAGDVFVNEADITVPPGDVYPADNHSEWRLGAGPNLIVEKWLSAGPASPAPGQVVTYTLHFLDDPLAWGTYGNVLVTDTLPAGLDFVGAMQRLCGPDGFFCQRDPDSVVGDDLVWDYGGWGGGNWNDLVIMAQVSSTVAGGTVLTNIVRIGTDNPGDVQPYWAVNADSVALTVTGAEQPLYLPVMIRNK